MDARGQRRDDARMLLELTDAELATACRAMAYQESERAKKMNPGMRGPIENDAMRFSVLAANSRRRGSAMCSPADAKAPLVAGVSGGRIHQRIATRESSA